MAGSLFESLTKHTAELHQRTLTHKTVQGIGDGTLPDETFRYYIEQDYQFLTRYTDVMAFGIIASNELAHVKRMADLVHSTVSVEMDALANLYAQFGGEPDRLVAITPAPTCRAYTNHLLAVAAERNPLLILAAMLPCQWGYRDIGRTLKANGLPGDERYAAWIEEYAADSFGDLVDWAIQTLDKLAESAGGAVLDRALEVFQLSAEYEYRFWEMAWTRETW